MSHSLWRVHPAETVNNTLFPRLSEHKRSFPPHIRAFIFRNINLANSVGQVSWHTGKPSDVLLNLVFKRENAILIQSKNKNNLLENAHFLLVITDERVKIAPQEHWGVQ